MTQNNPANAPQTKGSRTEGTAGAERLAGADRLASADRLAGAG